VFLVVAAAVLVAGWPIVTRGLAAGAIPTTPAGGVGLLLWGLGVLGMLGVVLLRRQRFIALVFIGVTGLVVSVSFALGWRPDSPRWLPAVAAIVLGTMAFAGIGLSMAGRLRGEINLAALNGLYLVLLLLGGMVIPFSKLPGVLADVARLLPSGALADVLRETLAHAGDQPGTSWIVLSVWAVASPLLARRLFRFD
jgi:ABC-2 type transport system permease protein